MILPYQELMRRGLAGELLDPFDPELVNPASIDIRVGDTVIYRREPHYLRMGNFLLQPKEFCLVSTYERLKVPIDCAMDLRLKSTRARQGYDHALAFWFDPGWDGIGTMEIVNHSHQPLWLEYGMKIAQVIYHVLSAPCEKPYAGRYQGATNVEEAKT